MTVKVPYDRINLIEYGQKVDRRLMEAILISPLMILSKKRQHYLTVGFEAENGQQQAMLFQVSKGHIRAILVSLEAQDRAEGDLSGRGSEKGGQGMTGMVLGAAAGSAAGGCRGTELRRVKRVFIDKFGGRRGGFAGSGHGDRRHSTRRGCLW